MNYLLFNSESIKAPVLIKNICLKKKISDILSFSILINITYHIMFLILKFKYFKKIHISYKKIITYRWDANIPKFYHLLQFIAYFRNIILTANFKKTENSFFKFIHNNRAVSLGHLPFFFPYNFSIC